MGGNWSREARLSGGDLEGGERISRNRRDKYITVDLGFPSRKWRGVANSGICRYVAEFVETGILL